MCTSARAQAKPAHDLWISLIQFTYTSMPVYEIYTIWLRELCLRAQKRIVWWIAGALAISCQLDVQYTFVQHSEAGEYSNVKVLLLEAKSWQKALSSVGKISVRCWGVGPQNALLSVPRMKRLIWTRNCELWSVNHRRAVGSRSWSWTRWFQHFPGWRHRWIGRRRSYFGRGLLMMRERPVKFHSRPQWQMWDLLIDQVSSEVSTGTSIYIGWLNQLCGKKGLILSQWSANRLK